MQNWFCQVTVNCHDFFKAYDQHLNMILGDVEETVTTVVIDDETYEEIYKVCYDSFRRMLLQLAVLQMVEGCLYSRTYVLTVNEFSDLKELSLARVICKLRSFE